MQAQELAEIVTATAEELMKKGEQLLLMSERLKSEAKQLRALPLPAQSPAALTVVRQVVGPMAEEIIEEFGAIELPEERSVGRFGEVTKTRAIDAAKELGVFTRAEFGELLGLRGTKVTKWIQLLVTDGQLDRFEDIDRTPKYRWLKLAQPSEHETKRPPENERPSYELAQATGTPVRITTERKDRRGRSTPGQRQKIVNRDRNYERMEAAKAERAAEQARKAKAEKGQPKTRRRGRSSVPV